MIKALSGCVIYFPSRPTSKDGNAVIFGHRSTRRRWGEEWVQLLIDLVDIEIRLEGENAFHLGEDLRCELVAQIQSQIDDSNFAQSLPKVVGSFLCTTSSDPSVKLTAQFFRPVLQRKFRSVVEEVARKAVYVDLLEKPTHHTQLSNLFEASVKKTLSDCGFVSISQSIRFTPVDPGKIGRRADIARRWMEWELDAERLRAEDELNRLGLEEDKKQKLLDKAEETAKKERQFKLREKVAERDYEAAIQALEIDIAKQRNAKEFRLAEVKKELEDFFNVRQRQNDEFKHELRVTELRNTESERKISEDEERSRVRRRLEDESDVRVRRLQSLADELAVAEKELELERACCERMELRAKAEATRLEATVRASSAVDTDMLKNRHDMLRVLFDKLPEILKSIPIEKVGETNLISVSRDLDNAEGSIGLGSIGLLAIPLVRRLVDLLNSGSKVRVAPASVQGGDGDPKLGDDGEMQGLSIQEKPATPG